MIHMIFFKFISQFVFVAKSLFTNGYIFAQTIIKTIIFLPKRHDPSTRDITKVERD